MNYYLQKFKDNILIASIIICSLSIYLPTIFKSLSITLFAFSIILYYILNAKKPEFNFNRTNSLLIVLYLLYIIGTFYSQNTKEALFDLEVKLPIIIFPFLFFFVPKHIFSTKNFNIISWVIVFGLLINIIFCFTKGIISWNNSSFDLLYNLTYVRLSSPNHPSYLSLFASISIVLLYKLPLSISFFKIINCINGIKATLIAIIGVFIFMLQSKSGIILLGISLLFIVWDIWFIKKKRIYSIVVLLLVVVSFFLNFNVKALNGRYVNAIEVIKEENDTKKTHNSTSERLDLYKSSINLFVQSPIFGYGSGDAKDVLKSRLKDSRDSYLNSLNAHNQFFQTALSIGGIGLLVLLSLFIIPIIYAIRSKHYVLVIILINFAIGFLFEAMLERIMGVYAFSFILVVINLFIGKEKMKHLKKTK